MAITNAQQYQQLVNKPANGKRPGYRGDNAYGKDSQSEQATSMSQATSSGNTNPSTSDRPGESGGDSYRRSEEAFNRGVGVGNLERLYEEGVPKSTLPGFLAAGLNLATPLRNKGLRKNIDYFKQNFSGPYTLDNYKEFMKDRMNQFTDDDDDDDNNEYIPLMAQAPSSADQETEVEEEEPFQRNFRLLADGGMPEDAPVYEGGIMDLESSRQMYGLGKLVKKITRGVKKIAKSPIGKAALLYAGGSYLKGAGFLKGGGPGGMFAKIFGANNTMPGFENLSTAKMSGILGKLGLTKGYGSIMPTALGGILGTSALSYFMTPEEEEEQKLASYGADIDDPSYIMNNPSLYTNRRLAAEGGSMDEPVAKKTMPLLDMDGQEMDLREEGGFVPLGRMERADDVPARLSKNEFVFTADAVRNAGEGDVDKGAEVMYNMMKNLESGGEVSEESQGLEGARDMFKTSQRLEEVL